MNLFKELKVKSIVNCDEVNFITFFNDLNGISSHTDLRKMNNDVM